MKCADCNATVEETFLRKIVGTYVGSGKSRKAICSACQKRRDRA
jgi:hypothetical protein